MDFKKKLGKIVAKNNSLLCIGLDADIDIIGKNQFDFNKKIIEETHDLVCAYKPNIAFYESNGIDGLKELKKTIEYLRQNYLQIPIVLDAKRADVADTSKKYATSVYEYWQADAVTVFPNLGFDSIKPFLEYKDKLTILLVKTSNPNSATFQNLQIDNEPYYLKVAKEIKKWNYSNVGVFVGATYPKELIEVRRLFPDKIFLSAGLGAQGGNTEEAVKAGVNRKGEGIMLNSSRSIIFSKKPRLEAQKLRDEINKYR